MARLQILAVQAAFLIILLAVWEWASRSGAVDAEFFPPPSVVIPAMVVLAGTGSFLSEAAETALRVLVSFLIAAPLALLVGFVLGENRPLGDRFAPFFNVVLAVPQSIFLPIFILVMGLGFVEKVAFGFTHVFFVVVVTTMAAVRQVPAAFVQATRSFGGDRWRIYRSIYFPAMAPQVMTGLRLGLIFDIIGILLAEMYGSRDGVGVLIYRWGESYQTVDLMAGILLVSLATISINELMRLWETRLNRWQPSL
jgi:ABC-type nitrate/sulfonate/bicarbonate transport system permease component